MVYACSMQGVVDADGTGPDLGVCGGAFPAGYRWSAGLCVLSGGIGTQGLAIAPGGVWAWQAELPSPEMAKQAALRDCSSHAGRPCLPNAVDQDVVLDKQAWRQVWRPYLTRAQAERAPRGMKRGQRFPDLRLTDDKSRVLRLSELRGRVVVLHFWGSWCPHCIRKMPDLQRLYDCLAGSREVAFVLLPVREAFAQARQWARGRRIRSPCTTAAPGDQESGLCAGQR